MLKGDDYGRRIVLDTTFDGGLVATTDALLLAGFQIAARVDVREELRRMHMEPWAFVARIDLRRCVAPM